MNLTGQDLAYIANKRRATRLMNELAKALNKWLLVYKITDRREIAYLIANMVPETGRFRAIEENLNYSEKGLIKTFSYYRNRPRLAKRHARKPEVIANTVYADKNRGPRYKLGNIHPGDGWKFRGGGPGQITGRNNHQEFEDATGIPVVEKPELLRVPDTGIQAMCVFWVKNPRLGRYARAGKVAKNRAAYNGGAHGLKLMKSCLSRAHKVAKRLQIAGPIIEHDPNEGKGPALPAPEIMDEVDIVLRVGSKGELVKRLQRALNKNQYHAGRVDGDFGKATRNAVAKLKMENDMDTSDRSMPITIRQAEDAKPHEAIRENMKMADLRKEGSQQIKNADLGQVATAATTATGIGYNVIPDDPPMAEQAEDILSQVENAKGMAARAQDLGAGLMDKINANATTLLVIVLVAAVTLFFFQRTKLRRLEEARELKNL